MKLLSLEVRRPATVDTVDWSVMPDSEGARLRELGLCEGASIEILHRGGLLGRGAVACRVGRMTIGMRAHHAAAVVVTTGPASPIISGQPA